MNIYKLPAFHSRITDSHTIFSVVIHDNSDRTGHNHNGKVTKVPYSCYCHRVAPAVYFSSKKGFIVKISHSEHRLRREIQYDWYCKLSKNELYDTKIQYYDEDYRLLLLNSLKDRTTAQFLKKNSEKLFRLKIKPVIKDKEAPVLEDRIKSFLPEGSNLLNKFSCHINAEDFARTGYFRNGEHIQCCNCLYQIHFNEIDKLLNRKNTDIWSTLQRAAKSVVAQCNLTFRSMISYESLPVSDTTTSRCRKRDSCGQGVTEQPVFYDSEQVLSAVEQDHRNKCKTYNNLIYGNQENSLQPCIAKVCNRLFSDETTFISFVDKHKTTETPTEVQHYLLLDITNKTDQEIKPFDNIQIIATKPDTLITNLSDLAYKLSELPERFEALRTDLINTTYKNREVSTAHNNRNSIVRDVKKIKLLETIEPFIENLFTKIEEVRNKIPSCLDSFTTSSDENNLNKIAQTSQPDAGYESETILKLQVLTGWASKKDQEEIRQLLQELLTEIKALSKEAAEQGLALLIVPQGVDNPLKCISPCTSLKKAQRSSAQMHSNVEQAEPFLSAVTESVLQPIRFILGDDYFYLSKEIRNKIFLETPSAAAAKGLMEKSSCSSSRNQQRGRRSRAHRRNRHDK